MRTSRTNVLGYLSLTSVLFLLIMFVTGCEKEGISPVTLEEEISFRSPVIHHVSVGGADICEALGLPTGCDANFSLTAIVHADGSVSGQWHDQFGSQTGGIHVNVDCVNIVDNGAVIGGVITNGTVGGVDISGLRAVTAVVDNGTSANDPPDQISFSLFPVEDFFPVENCGELTPADFPLLDLTNGQVKVN